jgi:hypothetical protein
LLNFVYGGPPESQNGVIRFLDLKNTKISKNKANNNSRVNTALGYLMDDSRFDFAPEIDYKSIKIF